MMPLLKRSSNKLTWDRVFSFTQGKNFSLLVSDSTCNLISDVTVSKIKRYKWKAVNILNFSKEMAQEYQMHWSKT